MSKLVIVESPTKVKTIGKYLGKEYTVMSSRGHIRDLPKKNLGVDVEHDFRPDYVVMDGKEQIVDGLKKAARDASHIILATDLDREGEAISWHIKELLKQKAKSKEQKEFQRVIFHEITKSAIEEAFKHPRDINAHLVDAYQARRVLDRVVGYTLSPLLWQKIRYGLSAGRVQSVVVRLVVEREREREKFESRPYFNLNLTIKTKNATESIAAQLVTLEKNSIQQQEKLPLFAGEYTVSSTKLTDRKKVEELEKEAQQHHYVVSDVEEKRVKRNPQPPLTTARLQRQAATRLGFSAKRTMTASQKLYEAGYITYHRTDSVFLSEDFIKNSRAYIESKLGKEYLSEKAIHYANKSKNAQEAHEAIRPSEVKNDLKHPKISKLPSDQKSVYSLIWRNAVASQMSPAVINQVRVDINSDKSSALVEKNPQCVWRANGSTVIFMGWMKVMGISVEDRLLPTVEVSEKLYDPQVSLSEHQTQPPPRYSEAALIKDLEKYSIGRPSTYAPVISTVEGRKYIIREEKYFIPGDTGVVVNDLLVKHFPAIVDLDFTAEMEEHLDTIARGEEEWVPVIREFYGPFIKLVEAKKKEIKKEDVVVLEKTDKLCPTCGKPLIIKLGRYGKFLSCSDFPKCEYAAPLVEGEPLTEEQQKELGNCPECGGQLVLKQGRFGSFIACSKYPKCKFTKSFDESIDMVCPQCKKGEVVKKRTKRGRFFFGCSRYPECDYASWTDPRQAEEKETKTEGDSVPKEKSKKKA